MVPGSQLHSWLPFPPGCPAPLRRIQYQALTFLLRGDILNPVYFKVIPPCQWEQKLYQTSGPPGSAFGWSCSGLKGFLYCCIVNMISVSFQSRGERGCERALQACSARFSFGFSSYWVLVIIGLVSCRDLAVLISLVTPRHFIEQPFDHFLVFA